MGAGSGSAAEVDSARESATAGISGGTESGPRPLYGALDRSRREIRLLRIVPELGDGPVQCTLEKGSLDDNAMYFTALSYVCGSEAITKEVIVDGHRRQVTTNLESALRNFRAQGASALRNLRAQGASARQNLRAHGASALRSFQAHCIDQLVRRYKGNEMDEEVFTHPELALLDFMIHDARGLGGRGKDDDECEDDVMSLESFVNNYNCAHGGGGLDSREKNEENGEDYAETQDLGESELEDDSVFEGLLGRAVPKEIFELTEKSARPLRVGVGLGQFPIWIDSLCINQDDLAEKSHQIQLMRHIYARAHIVFSWLGPADEGNIDLALRLVRKIAPHLRHGTGFRWTRDFPFFRRGYDLEDPVLCGHRGWKAIQNFEDSEYFQRLWTFQELYAANQCVFICGHDYLPFVHLYNYHWWAFYCKGASISLNSIPGKPRYTTIWGHLRRQIPRFEVISHVLGAFDGTRLASLRTRASTFIDLVHDLHCKDAHDRVFALLGPFPLDINPDYNMPVAEVYARWATNPRLNIPPELLLRFSGIGLHPPSWEDSTSIPSWLPNLALLGQQFRGCAAPSDPSLYSVLDIPDKCQPTVSTTGGIRCFGVLSTKVHELATCAFKTAKQGAALTGKDFISELVDKSPELLFMVLRYLIANGSRLCGESYHLGGLRLTAFIKTIQQCIFWTDVPMMGDQNSQHPWLRGWMSAPGTLPTHSPARTLENLIVYIFDQINIWAVSRGIPRVFHFEKTWNDLHESDDGREQQVEQKLFPTLVYNLVLFAMEQRLFYTTEDLIGGGPPGMEPGDMVYLIHGLPQPVLLRRVDGKLRHVGVCYVHGITGADGLKILESRKSEVQEINIV